MIKALGGTELWVCQWVNYPQNTNSEIPDQTKHVKNLRGEALAWQVNNFSLENQLLRNQKQTLIVLTIKE